MTDAEKAQAGMKEVENFLNLTWLYTPDMAQDTAKGLHEALAEVARLEVAGADEEAIHQALTDQLARRNRAEPRSHQVKGWMLVTVRSMVRRWLVQGEHQDRLRGNLAELDALADRLIRLRAARATRH